MDTLVDQDAMNYIFFLIYYVIVWQVYTSLCSDSKRKQEVLKERLSI